MSQLVKISFKDSQNWINSKSQIINWDNLAEFYKEDEVAPHYLPPQIFGDTWNGKDRDVQHIRHDTYRLEIIAQSSELIELSRMQSCDIVNIHDINSGMIIQVVDMQKSEWLNFGEPERISNTSSWSLTLIYRTNKTVINKFEGLENQLTVVGGSDTYYSKYEKIPLDIASEPIKVQWGEGGEKLLHETQKSGSQVLFYMNKADKDALNKDWGQNDFTIDGINVLTADKIPLEITNLGEDNYKIILSGVTTRETVDSTAALDNVVKLQMGPIITYSKFAKLESTLEPEQVIVRWSDSSDKLLRSINSKGYNILLYLNETEMNSFKSTYYGSSTIDVDTVTMEEKLTLEITQLASGYYQIIVPVIYSVLVGTVNLTPDNTHTLVITDGSAYTFYTDYATEPNTPNAEKDPINNETGLLVDAKIISRQVTDIKLFLNTADKNSLKFHYEKSTAATIDAVPILYRGIVSETELGKDLWEVNIKGLTTTPLVTNPL